MEEDFPTLNKLAMEEFPDNDRIFEQESKDFKIDDDTKAEWALTKIAEDRAESQRYIDTCKNMIEEYKLKIEAEEIKLVNKTSYLTKQLQDYFNTVKTKKSKTQETYRLPSGTLKKKFPAPEFIKDNEKLLNYLKNNNPNFIKVKEEPNWAEFKKTVTVENGNIITEDGEVLGAEEGITVQERNPYFEVDI